MTDKFAFNNPTKKPNAIVAAMGAQADQDALAAAIGASSASPAEPALIAGLTPAQLNAAIREAALVMPGKQAIREIGQQLASDLDRHLETALRRALSLGPDDDVEQALTGHAFEVVPDGAFDADHRFVSVDERGETFTLDGKPLLWAGPVRLERQDDGDQVQVKGNRRIRHYQEEGAPCSS